MTSAVSQTASEASLSRAARGSVLNLIGGVVGAVTTLAMTIVITRLSSPVEAGLFFSATSVFLIAINIGRLGTNTGLVYFISGSRGRGEFGLARPYMRMAARPVVVVAVLTSLVLLLGAELLASWLSPERADTFALSLRLMALLVPLASLANLATAASQGLGTMKVFALVDQMFLPGAQLVLVTIALMAGAGWVAPMAWASAYVPATLLAWLWWSRLATRLDPPGTAQVPSSSRPFWKFTAPRALANVSQIVMQRLDIILVGALAGLGAAAVYTAATRFLVLGQMAGRAISLSIQPLLGGALARADLRDARHLYQTCTCWLIIGTWPLYLLLVSFAPQALSIFGDGYGAGSSAVILLSCAMLFATACGTVDIVLNMAGRSMWNLMNVLISLTVFISLDLWLIPTLGFMGAAIGWAAAIVVANLLPLLQILHTPGIHPFGKPALTAMVANLACFGVLPWVCLKFGSDREGSAIIALVLGVIAYTIFLVLARRSLQLKLLTQVARRGRRAGRAVAVSNA